MPAGARVRILVVEDEDLVRDYTKTVITSLGYEVAAAVSLARQALDLLAAGEQIDLMLIDLVMPGGISGLQLAVSVLHSLPEMPILLVSGRNEDLSAYDSLRTARVEFLRKPFRKRELAERLSALLGERRDTGTCR